MGPMGMGPKTGRAADSAHVTAGRNTPARSWPQVRRWARARPTRAQKQVSGHGRAGLAAGGRRRRLRGFWRCDGETGLDESGGGASEAAGRGPAAACRTGQARRVIQDGSEHHAGVTRGTWPGGAPAGLRFSGMPDRRKEI